MNAVEIEEAVSKLAEAPFEPEAFPYAFLEAFGNKETTLKRLKSGNTNQSDLPGGVLQRNNIHLKVCPEGEVSATLAALRESAATLRQKAKFILATDGQTVEAERLADGETLASEFKELPNRFTFFLSLAGITTVKQIEENAFDIRATGRLNKLYVELLKVNPEWDTAARREDLNHFFARLIFCFFAEDTNIFIGARLFTNTIEQMTERDGSNTHEVLAELFRAMNTGHEDRPAANFRPWAGTFPYVNGNLFSGSTDAPRFSRIARALLLHVGQLDWTKINPDIFGSMIQAVADDEERGALGMHYTSVPNILKVLNPLFLDDLRAKLAEACDDDPNPKRERGTDPNPKRERGTDPNPKRERGTPGGNPRKLLNLRNRLARIRVFDPACGSGNFLVIAYKEMRAIEAEINLRRGERDRPSEIPPTNFRGIELRHFAAEIARLALIIAKFQCDVLYRGPQRALADFLPLEKANWITCGNALRLDWLSICPPTGTGVKLHADDLFSTPLDQAEIEFENQGGETYICGNPPYKGAREQTKEQKKDLAGVFEGRTKAAGLLDYVSGWFMKAADYGMRSKAATAFVSTNSICQGQLVPILWPLVLSTGHRISFAHTSFKWANLASHNAGVTVVVVGLSREPSPIRAIYTPGSDGEVIVKQAENINAYLIAGPDLFVEKRSTPLSQLSAMNYGNYPGDGNHLTLTRLERDRLLSQNPALSPLIRPVYGAQEFLKGLTRYCLWIDDEGLETALQEPEVARRIEEVRSTRVKSRDPSLNKLADRPHQYRDRNTAREHMVLAPTITSERRDYIPADLKSSLAVTTNQAFAIYDGPLHDVALISSRLHVVWIGTVCGRLKTDYRYSSALGWNTFPVPTLTDQNKADLTRCAEEILLAREAHFPATIADLYDPDEMPDDLRQAHERNDEVLERIYIGRRFKNDTERLEKLFELYTQMTAAQTDPNPKRKRGKS